jgi:hypothetical protein
MAAATPLVYQANAFRITGLPVDASERELKRHADKLKMLAELGTAKNAKQPAFALPKPPSTAEITAAMSRLSDPEQRLIDEFFWFWPKDFGNDSCKSSADPALRLVSEGNADGAYQIWREWENDAQTNFIAWHNIAIAQHLSALDWTQVQFIFAPDAEKDKAVEAMWEKAFQRWEKVVPDDRIWEVLKARVRQINDPRLTTGFVRRMRDTFPEAQDKINAEIAVKFAEMNRLDWAKKHIVFMNQTNQGLDDVEKTSLQVLTPARKRVRQHLEAAEEECKRHPAKANGTGKALHQNCYLLQKLFELFFGKEGRHKSELFDEVADQIVNCAVAYQKCTNDNKEFIDVLLHAMPFATNIKIRQRIQNNIDVGEGNLEAEKYNGIYDKLSDVQGSKVKAKDRLWKMKHVVIPDVLAAANENGTASKGIQSLMDAIAVVLRGISVDAHNNEEDMVTATEAIQLASKFVRDADLKKRINEDVQTLRKNADATICAHCNSVEGVKKYASTIAMNKITEKDFQGNVRYLKRDIEIPCCEKCHLEQQHEKNASWRISLWCLLAGAIIGGIATPWGSIVGSAIVIATLGILLGLICFKSNDGHVGMFGVGCLLGGPIGAIALVSSAIDDITKGRSLSFISKEFVPYAQSIPSNIIIGGFALWLVAFVIARKIIHSRIDKRPLPPKTLALVSELMREGWEVGREPSPSAVFLFGKI